MRRRGARRSDRGPVPGAKYEALVCNRDLDRVARVLQLDSIADAVEDDQDVQLNAGIVDDSLLEPDLGSRMQRLYLPANASWKSASLWKIGRLSPSDSIAATSISSICATR